MMTTTPDIKKKRRRPLLMLALIAVVGVTAIAPFAFTTLIVRRAISFTSLAEMNPEIQSASISLLGSLQLENVKLHDGEHHAVIATDTLRIEFNWGDLLNQHVRQITASGLNITLRPDRNGNPTLLQLLAADSGKPAGAPSDSRFVCEQFIARGLIVTEGYGLPQQTPYTATFGMAGTELAPIYDLNIAIPDRLMADATLTPGEIVVRRLVVSPTEFTFNPAMLPPTLAKYVPEPFRGSPLTVKTGDLIWAGNWRPGHQLAMAGELKNFSAYFADDKLPAVRDLSVKTDRFYISDSLDSLAFNSLTVQCGTLSTSQLQAGKLNLDATAYEGNLRIRQINAELAGGRISGNNSEIDLPHGSVKQLRLAISNIDQHELVKNLAPGKLDATGRVNGAIDISTHPETGQLQGAINLTAAGEGRLMIGDMQALQERIRKRLGNNKIADLVILQLRNYPYSAGNLRLRSDGTTPEITLNYTRKPLKAGDAGYNEEIEIEGRKLKANQAVQINDLTIAMPEQSIENILLMTAGVQNWLGRRATATMPATTQAVQVEK